MTFNASLTPLMLANMALSKLGLRSTIGSLSENSPEAAQCLMWYKMSLAQTLSAYNWNFARARRALELYTDPDTGDITQEPPPEWAFRYQMHSSILTPRFLENPGGRQSDAIPYSLEYASDGTLSLLTDLEDAVLVYTADLTDDQSVTLFPPHFIEAFTSCLAMNIAFTLTGSLPLKQEKTQEFILFLKAASAIDGNSVIDDKPRDAEGIRGRV